MNDAPTNTPIENDQAAIDAVYAWFSRPYAERGSTTGGSCVYRGDEDPKSHVRCAIGCLMPDELYDSEFEAIGSIPAVMAENRWYETGCAAHFANVETGLLCDMQDKHDSAANVRQVLNGLIQLSGERNLLDPSRPKEQA